jgi:hypothetical protein
MNRTLMVALGLAVAACTSGCKKSSETERKEADKATVEARGDTNEAQTAAIDEQNDYLAAVRREQLELRGKVQQEIDDIDEKLLALKVNGKDATVDPHAKDAKKISALLERRTRFEADVGRIERSDERGWDQTKAEIEHDLATARGEGGGRTHLPGKI